MMNYKKVCKEMVVAYFKVLAQYTLEDTEENYGSPQSG
jgi:hypothetical protein